jgi:hypothetical protein
MHGERLVELCFDGHACVHGDSVYCMITPFTAIREKDDHCQKVYAWHNHELPYVIYKPAYVVCGSVVHGDGYSLI